MGFMLEGGAGKLLELQSPWSFRACFFVFIVYSLLVAYYPQPIVYRIHPPRFLLFILIQLRHFSFIITTIYTATYLCQHLRRCHPIECDTEVFRYIFST